MFDLVIRGGQIVDGTRFPRYKADIGITDGRIVRIGTISANEGREVIDAAGLIVAPGHIDAHTHYDAQINWDPYCSNSGENGCTTVITGNCGFGLAPCRPDDRDRYMYTMENTEQVPYEQMKLGLSWNWETFPEWMEHLRSLPKGVNVVMFVPINPLLVYVMGPQEVKNRRPTKAELERMKGLIKEGMDAGASGIALSMLGDANSHVDYDGSPMPSDIMHWDDAAELASALADRDEGVVQVMCLLGPTDRTGAAAKLWQAARRPILLNAIVLSELMPGFGRQQLDQLDALTKDDSRIYAQSLLQHQWQEFTLMGFNLNDHIPGWLEFSSAKTEADLVARLREPAHRQMMRETYDPAVLMIGCGDVEKIEIIGVNDNPALAHLVGRKIGEIAVAEGKHPLDVMLDTAADAGGLADFRTPPTAAGDVEEAIEVFHHPYVLAGTSDGGAHSKNYIGGQWATDLLAWFARDSKKTTLEEAHYRFSYQIARVLGLAGRGALLEGNAADIIIYDLETLNVDGFHYQKKYDLPGGDWRRYVGSSGYRWIVVNGRVTFVDGVPTGDLSGRVVNSRPDLLVGTMGRAEAA